MPKKPKHTLAEIRDAQTWVHLMRRVTRDPDARAAYDVLGGLCEAAINQRTASKANLGRGHRKVKV